MCGTTLLPKQTQRNTLTLTGSYSYLNRASGFALPSDWSQFTTTEIDSRCWGEEVGALTEPSHPFTCRSMGRLLKWPLKHSHPLMLTTCLLVPLSRHTVATLAYLWVFLFFPPPDISKKRPRPGPVVSGRGLMVFALCTVYKSISDGSVWISATFNLIKWKREEKKKDTRSSDSIFGRLFPHIRARVHIRSHAHDPESFSRWTEQWKPSKREGIKYNPLWGDRKRRATQKKIWFMKVWLFSILECQCHGNVVNGQVEGGSWMRGQWMAGKERRLLTSRCFPSFHQTSSLYQSKA